MQTSHSAPVQPGKYVATSTIKTIYSVGILFGVLAFGAGLLRDPQRIWFSFLVSFFYFLCLGLGGLFFTSLQHVSNAGWSVNIRRISESLAAFLPLGAIMAIVLLVGSKNIYSWLDSKEMAHDAVLMAKHAYLNCGFFILRLVVFFALWLGFSNSLLETQSNKIRMVTKNSL